jgi:hypothetical protein
LILTLEYAVTLISSLFFNLTIVMKIRQCIEDLTDITAQLKEEKKEGSTGSFQLPSSSQ